MFTRSCATGVSAGPLGRWKSSSIRAGRVWIYLWGATSGDGHAGRLAPARFAAPAPGRFVVWKTMIIAPAGGPVVVRVAPSSVRRLRLAFRLPQDSPAPLAAGQIADRFAPCAAGVTFFNGGLIVAGAQCGHLQVSQGGGRPVGVVAALGRRRCMVDT